MYFACLVIECKNAVCYLSVSTLASKNISGTLFVVCLSLNTFFLPFYCILASKTINKSYPAVVYTLNTSMTPYIFENEMFTVHPVVCFSKHQSYLYSFFDTSKYVMQYVLFCFLAFK